MKFANLVLVALVTAALAACSHHENNAQPSNLVVGTDSILTNTDYQGRLVNVRPQGIRSLMREACDRNCQNYSPDATIDFAVTTSASAESGATGVLVIQFPSIVGGDPVTVRRNITFRQQRRAGGSASFTTIDSDGGESDLSGRLDPIPGGGQRLSLSSRDGLIGEAQIAN